MDKYINIKIDLDDLKSILKKWVCNCDRNYCGYCDGGTSCDRQTKENKKHMEQEFNFDRELDDKTKAKLSGMLKFELMVNFLDDLTNDNSLTLDSISVFFWTEPSNK